MKEKKFLRLMNSKKYKDNERVYFSIIGLLKDEKQEIIPYKPSFIRRIFKLRKSKDKTANEIITDNFELILNNLSCYGCNPQIIRILLKREELRPFLKLNFMKILEIVKRDVDKGSESLDGFLQYDMCSLVNDFMDTELSGVIAEYAEQIIESTNINELFKVIQLLKVKNPQLKEFLNKKLEENKNEIAQILILDSIRLRRVGVNELDIEEYSKNYGITLLIMIDELLQSEGKRWIDLSVKDGGTYSDVFEIGEKILKIGQPRKTYKIPYSRRILQPLLRTNFDADGKDIACVEICEKVDTDFECDEQETLYEIYKELREKGIIWTDPKPTNIGRLKKENVVTLNGEKMEVDSGAVGFEGEIKEEPLKEGDFVIIDTDYLYREDDPELFWGNDLYGDILEKKYQQEKQEEIARKFREQINVVRDSKEKSDLVKN